MAGIRFNIRVRLEGILVKFNTATVVSRREGPCVATVSLAPTKEIPRILPKTLCHIFYWDGFDSKWHLLFEGEVTGKGRVKEEGHRAFTVTAQGISNHFYRAYVYMLNQDLGINYADNIRIKGIGSDRPYTVAQHFADRKNLLAGDIEGSFAKILGAPANIGNAFYTDAWKRLKITERIKALPDPQVAELYRRRAYLEQLWESAIRQSVSDVAPIINLTAGLARLLYYDWTEIPTPATMDSSIVFKPDTYFCPVPRCNTYFPCRYGQFSEERDFMSEPTRLILNTNLAQEQLGDGEITNSSIIRVAPEELQKQIDAVAGGKSSTVQNQIANLSTKFLTEEEKVKGIIPVFTPLSPSEWVVIKGAAEANEPFGDIVNKEVTQRLQDAQDKAIGEVRDGAIRAKILARLAAARKDINNKTTEAKQRILDGYQAVKDDLNQYTPGLGDKLAPMPDLLKEGQVGAPASSISIAKDPIGWLSNIANYKFFLLRAQHRSLSMNHSFNPWTVAGFPGAVLDQFGNIFGMVEAVTHNVTVDGGTTSIQLSHTINPLDEDIPGAQIFPELPPWFSSQYANGSAYQTILGSATVGSSAEACAAELDTLMERYRKNKNKLDMALNYNRRPVITEEDFYKFLGANMSGANAAVVSGGPFRSINQTAIKAHVNFLANRRGVPAP